MEGFGGSFNNLKDVILDHEEGIKLWAFHPLRKNNFVITQMLEGMFMCYRNMKELEEAFAKEAFKSGVRPKSYFDVGTTPRLQELINQSVNIFNWYALTLMNYANYCGLASFMTLEGKRIDDLNDKKVIDALRLHKKKYVESINELAAVKLYRDKVAAHLAVSDPLHLDSIGTLMQSNSVLPAWKIDRLVIPGWQYSYGSNQSEIGQNPWSLTENFERLTPRYFKQYFTIPPYSPYQHES
jgi:hypothetical protein